MTDQKPQVKTSLKGQGWLEARALQRVFNALEPHGRARVAGGAVRDALLGRPVADVDIATDIEPDDVIAILEAAGIKTVPTGLDHGTVTAVAGPGETDVYQITTLRHDVETDGRRAAVSFTDDWSADASRRDLTMNALYCDRHGELFDPLDGYDDLCVGRVRFVGDASQRIEEDYLRILRFFRFNAMFGHAGFDEQGLAACGAHRQGLDRLSGERIHQELFKLLQAPGAVSAIGVMADNGILEHVVPVQCDIARFSRMCAIEEKAGRVADALLRLAALAVHGRDDAVRLRDHLVLTNAQSARLEALVSDRAAFDDRMTVEQLRETLYRLGTAAFADKVLFDWAVSENSSDDRGWADMLRLPDVWKPPVFPLRGGDVLSRGVERGPRVGDILAAVENWWIEAGFPNDETLVREHLETVLKTHRKT